MNGDTLRRCAAYAAADVLVATHYGVRVMRIEITASGADIVRGNGGTPAEHAALAVAGEEGQYLLGLVVANQAGQDAADCEARFGRGALVQARADVCGILLARRAELCALAARLERERVVIFREA